MNKLSPDKRKQLVLAAVVVAGLLAGLGYGLIRPQYQTWLSLAGKREAARDRLRQVKQAIEHADQIESQLAEASQRLAKIETDMASGDLYSWAIDTIRKFRLGYKVDIPQFSQIDGPKDMPMLPRFPYKQATLTISGTAYYFDLGKFIADFENQFPYARLSNLTIEPVQAASVSDREKLAFKVDIATLVKPTTS